MRQATKDQIKRGAVAAPCTVPSFAHGTGFLGRVSLSSSPSLFYNSCDVLNSISFNLIPFNSVPFHSVPLHSVPLSACPQPWPSAVFWCIQHPLCLSVEGIGGPGGEEDGGSEDGCGDSTGTSGGYERNLD